MNERIWYKKYQPEHIKDYVFQNEDTKNKVLDYISNGDIPNLLIDGIQGTGKSTLAKIFINEFNVDPSDLRIINASSESGIDKIREDVSTFCKTYPHGKFKLVLFEEADGLSTAAQKSLRSIIDDASDTTRFIFTCNYASKIIPPLLSRFQNIHIDSFDEEALVLKTAEILDKETISFEPDTLIDHVEKFKPDLRKIINSIQECSVTGTLESPNNTSSSSENFLDEWSLAWNRRPTYDGLSKYVLFVDNNNFEQVFDIMYSSQFLENKERNIPIIAEHLYKAYTVSNQSINLDACLIRMFNDV